MHESSFRAISVPSTCFGGCETIIAVAALVGDRILTEIAQQVTPPAIRRRCEIEQLPQKALGFFAFLRILYLTDEMALLRRIACAEEERTIASEAVAAGTPGFLVIAFDVLGEIVVHDVAHVRLVDTHAEGNRRAHNADLIVNE